MTDDKTRVNAKIDKDVYETAKAKLDHGGISREIRKTFQRIAHGAEVSEREQIKDRRKEWRDDRRELKHERQAINNQLDELEVKIERAENRLDDLRDKQGEYEGALQMIEDGMHEHGERVFPGHKKIQRAAELGECDAEDVISDLQERNPDLPDEQFTVGGTV
jgi:predicted nuclease with TOPRIM domain